MKKAIKALPALSLMAYLAAVVLCIVFIIRGNEPPLSSIIIFIIYVIGVIVLMSFATNFLIKKKLGGNSKDDDAFEELAAVAAEAEAEAEEKSETEESEDEAEESEEPAAPEIDVISTEGADEEEPEDSDPIVVPLIVPVDNDDDEEADDDDDDDDEDDDDDLAVGVIADGDAGVSGFARSRYTRTYAAKLIQADDELKGYYSTVKNAFMSYKKVTCSVSREHERVRRGRTTIGIIKVRGKSLLLYLALDPSQFENTMYVGEDVSGVSKYAATPFLYRIKGPRKANRAVKLIDMLAEKMEMVPTKEPANEDYVARFPYEDVDALVERGLIIDNIAEAERKAEEARIAAEEAGAVAHKAIEEARIAAEEAEAAAHKAIEEARVAAEEAEAAAHKAIEEAIKAKEHATKVSERSERTVDEIEAAEEAKAAKQDSAEK